MVGGMVLALPIAFLLRNAAWRRAFYLVGVAAAVIYFLAQSRGYDQWDAYEALWYGGGAAVGWSVGFVIVAITRRHGSSSAC
jgi:hypothetical protein